MSHCNIRAIFKGDARGFWNGLRKTSLKVLYAILFCVSSCSNFQPCYFPPLQATRPVALLRHQGCRSDPYEWAHQKSIAEESGQPRTRLEHLTHRVSELTCCEDRHRHRVVALGRGHNVAPCPRHVDVSTPLVILSKFTFFF